MTTLSLPLVPTGKAHPHPRDVVRAELTKFRSLRSSYWSIAATAVVTIGLAVLVTQSAVGSYSGLSPAEQASFDGTSKSLSGLILGQLAIGVLGVLAITSEYSTGLIRTSLAAVPHRRTFLAAKAAVVGLVALIAGTAICSRLSASARQSSTSKTWATHSAIQAWHELCSVVGCTSLSSPSSASDSDSVQ